MQKRRIAAKAPVVWPSKKKRPRPPPPPSSQPARQFDQTGGRLDARPKMRRVRQNGGTADCASSIEREQESRNIRRRREEKNGLAGIGLADSRRSADTFVRAVTFWTAVATEAPHRCGPARPGCASPKRRRRPALRRSRYTTGGCTTTFNLWRHRGGKAATRKS